MRERYFKTRHKPSFSAGFAFHELNPCPLVFVCRRIIRHLTLTLYLLLRLQVQLFLGKQTWMSLGWEALLKTLHFELRATLGIVVEFQEARLEDLPQQWLSTNASQLWAVIQEDP
mmetsp:Transcript_14385/g.58599  ORF Transcript_14385/g.58599 Transcript_14385/m.58599 type:complete len:115 (+) Transcript_14385:626-970(+)